MYCKMIRRSDDDYRSGFTVRVGYSKSGIYILVNITLHCYEGKSTSHAGTKSTCKHLTKHRTYHTLQITELKQNKDMLDKGVKKL